jgi:hypothetical protein
LRPDGARTSDAPAAPARVPWAWLCLLAPLPLLVHSLGAPLGQAVAEDFDFLHRALFSRLDLLDGGGSNAFWRPLSHQLYYVALAPVILDHPGLVATLHFLLLGLSSVLIYRAFWHAWPPAWAAIIATFPLLSESTRTLIAWPSHFVDLGVWLFTALLLHETAARRLWSALAALLAALLCKEVAVVAAMLVPWMPGIGPSHRRERLRWAAAMGALAIAWAAAYWAVRQSAGLHLPHDLETSAATIGTPLPVRVAWAAWNSLRAYLSLPAAHTPREVPLGFAAAGLLAVALWRVLSRARRRGLPPGARALAVWGLAWFIGASATMAPIFPLWSPNRSGYGSLGLGVLAVAFLGAAHSTLPGVLVALRLFAFAFSPPPPAAIAVTAPRNGAFIDFERLVRLQRFVRATHEELLRACPTLPHDARIGRHLVPRDAMYAFGDLALQVLYGDTTVRWLPFGDFLADTAARPVTIVEYQQGAARQVALVNPEAMRTLLRGADRITHHAWAEALPALARADSLQADRGAGAFLGIVGDRRALALAALGRDAEAIRDARRAVRLWPEAVDSRYVLARLWARAGRFEAATLQLDTLLAISPADSGAARLRRQILAVSEGPLGAGTHP